MGIKVQGAPQQCVDQAMMGVTSCTRTGHELTDVTITLPIRVQSEANQREHWAKKRARTAQHRAVAGMMVERTGIARHIVPEDRICVTFTRLFPRRGKPMDSDNLAGAHKAARDGVADALGIDDGSERYDWVYQQTKAADYGVQVRIARIRAA